MEPPVLDMILVLVEEVEEVSAAGVIVVVVVEDSGGDCETSGKVLKAPISTIPAAEER